MVFPANTTEYLGRCSKYDFISIDYKEKLNIRLHLQGYENCLQGEYFIETKRF